MSLAEIPAGHYTEYRYNVIFGAYKWDPQVRDENTVSHHVILISPETARTLCTAAQRLSDELSDIERALLARPDLFDALGFSGKIKKLLGAMGNYDCNDHVRLMRYDFHYTDEGWKISEVNSDVPGGLAEASILPNIAAGYFMGCRAGEDVASHMLRSFQGKLSAGARIAFVHATSYADDRQVMQFISDYFRQNGYSTVFAAPDHIRWENKKAKSIIAGEEGPVDGIVRFFPLEWFTGLPRKSGWSGYFDCGIPCCNHPAAMLTQSKRLPLVWDELGVCIPNWKTLLEETKEPRSIKKGLDGWIYKPAFGRVGAGISIKGAVSEKECRKIEKAARSQRKGWVAQRMFRSVPVISPDGKSYHVCIGVFTVDGRAAGFYARLSGAALINESAQDVPVLIVDS